MMSVSGIIFGGLALLMFRSALALQPHQSEHEVLVKFMEELQN